jgi:hypothetical protein
MGQHRVSRNRSRNLSTSYKQDPHPGHLSKKSNVEDIASAQNVVSVVRTHDTHAPLLS